MRGAVGSVGLICLILMPGMLMSGCSAVKHEVVANKQATSDLNQRLYTEGVRQDRSLWSINRKPVN